VRGEGLELEDCIGLIGVRHVLGQVLREQVKERVIGPRKEAVAPMVVGLTRPRLRLVSRTRFAKGTVLLSVSPIFRCAL
jgi:hypothetical protein